MFNFIYIISVLALTIGPSWGVQPEQEQIVLEIDYASLWKYYGFEPIVLDMPDNNFPGQSKDDA